MGDCCIASIESASFEYGSFYLGCGKTEQFTYAAGQTIAAGSVVSVSVSDEIVFDNSDPLGIAPFDIDTTGGAAVFPLFRGGKFNEDKLTIAAAGTPDDVRVALSKVGITLNKVYA